MSINNKESLKNRVSQLLEDKRNGRRVDNELHDCAAELSQSLLADRFPNRTWIVATQNKKGIDIQGYLGSKLDVTCEVVTNDLFLGNRSVKIRKDLQRLQDADTQNKFLVVVYAEVLIGLKNMRSKELLKGIEVLDLLSVQSEKFSN